LTIVKNLAPYLDVLEEQEFHEPHPQEYLEASSNHLFQPIKETRKSWTAFDGEQPLELDIEEFLTYLSEYPLCTQETNHVKEDDVHSMVEEDIYSGSNEEVNQGHHHYIERWFEAAMRLKHHSLLQQLFTSYHSM